MRRLKTPPRPQHSPPPAWTASRPAFRRTPRRHTTRPVGSALRGACATPPTTLACKATRGCGGVERHRAHIGQGGRNPAAGCRKAGRARSPRLRLHRQVARPGAMSRWTHRHDGSSIRALHRSSRSRGGHRLVPEPAQQIRFATARRSCPPGLGRPRELIAPTRTDVLASVDHPNCFEGVAGRHATAARGGRFVWQPSAPASRPPSAPPAAAPPAKLPGCSGPTVRTHPWSARLSGVPGGALALPCRPSADAARDGQMLHGL